MATTIPSAIPFNKSENWMATTVIIKGINCSQPSLYICLNKETLASLYPTTSKTAAKHASGILFKIEASKITLNNKNTP